MALRVELLYWEQDPGYMAARQRLVEVLTEDAFETPIQMIAVGTAADAEFLSMPGSPTIRIEGGDIDPDGAGAVGLYLRAYPSAGGTRSDSLPSKAMIREAVERARGWSHGRRA
jgi:hypothetical protein